METKGKTQETKASNDSPLTDSRENVASKSLNPKSVNWAPFLCTQYVGKLSENDIRSFWYSQAEFESFKKEAICIMKLAKSGKLKDKQSFCTRGLEAANSRGASLQESRRKAAWDIVLEEQTDQCNEGMHSAESIAELYEGVSVLCQREAHLQALRDREEVLLMLENDASPTAKKLPVKKLFPRRFLRRNKGFLQDFHFPQQNRVSADTL